MIDWHVNFLFKSKVNSYLHFVMINGSVFSLDSQMSKFSDRLMPRRWCLPFAGNALPKCNSGIYAGDIVSSWYRNISIPFKLYCLYGSS